MTLKQAQKLCEAREAVTKAERVVNALLRGFCPIGSEIEYEVRYGVRGHGVVNQHSTWGEKIGVKSSTGKTYWVSAYQILKAKKELGLL